jgi:toxin-antitoxin system PIN domain toxin
VILVDANLLIYAYGRDLPEHPAAISWLDGQLNGSPRVGLPWPSLLAFVRLVINPKVFKTPTTAQRAWEQVERWLAHESVWIPQPASRHPEILGRLLRETRITSKLVPDLHLAALAIEHDLTLYSSDGDFKLFHGLKWQNPLIEQG